MFGNPRWFRPKTFGWGLVPITWQGWVYTLVWAALAAGPFNVLLLYVHQWPLAVLWLVAIIAIACWDVAAILAQMPRDRQ